jgi:ligand-binding sensor domain-containing protein
LGPGTFESGTLAKIEISPELSRETVNAIFQDRTGAMWFGTGTALFRYDQSRLTIFTNSPGSVVAATKVIIEDHLEPGTDPARRSAAYSIAEIER